MIGTGSQNGPITINEILVHVARKGVKDQREDGAFPPGRNYTYDEPETPVRTTSQWLLTLSRVFELTGDEKFADAGNAAIDYLLRETVRPHGYTYHARKAEAKDHCNGLVGQAAPIRGLVKSGKTFERRDAIETAEEVFELHPFNKDLGLWERIEIDGTNLSFDRTLNHQIIFAAAARRLAPESTSVNSKLQIFLDSLKSNMELHPDGLIKHYVHPPWKQTLGQILSDPQYYNLIINEIAYHYYSFSSKRKKKERGYQTVNLYALARLHRTFPDHELWETGAIESAIKFVKSNQSELVSGIRVKHGSPLQGISIAKVLAEFDEITLSDHSRIIESDIVQNPLQSERVFDIDALDSNTRAALISELVDLPNIHLNP